MRARLFSRALPCVFFLLLAACAHQRQVNPTPVTKPTVPAREVALRFEFKSEIPIGKTKDGKKLFLGGFSGLRFLGKNANGELRFLANTDRGPNADSFEKDGKVYRPFVLPEFQPRILYLVANPQTQELRLEKMIPLLKPDGRSLTGVPSRAGVEVGLDPHGNPLPIDPYGLDAEGIAPGDGGTYWISDEYGPSLALFSPEGKLLEQLKPGEGLPKVFERVRINRGFEGLARHEDKLYAMAQSPLDNPRSVGEANAKKSSLVRILEVDLREKRTSAQYAYLLGPGDADKIGDIAVDRAGNLLVVEQNGKTGQGGIAKVFRYRFTGATNLQLLPDRIVGPGGSLELLSPKEREALGVAAGFKEEVCDLRALGVHEE